MSPSVSYPLISWALLLSTVQLHYQPHEHEGSRFVQGLYQNVLLCFLLTGYFALLPNHLTQLDARLFLRWSKTLFWPVVLVIVIY